MKLGNLNLSDIKLGTQQVKKVILGNNLVWQSINYIISVFKTRVFAVQGEFEAETCLSTQLTDLDNKGLLDSASFVLTPNAYEENILFSVTPNTSAADLTVSRTTLGTRVNADGDIEQVPYNLIQYSQDWTQTVWTKGGATVVSSTRLAPDGTSTATELSDVGASGTPNAMFQNNIIATATTITYSIYTKAVSLTTNGRRTFLLRNGTTSTNFDNLAFDYSSTGNLGNGWFSENVGNGWFRLTYTRSTGINVGNILVIYYGRGGAAAVGATDVWQVWGAQVVQGTQAKDYFPVTTRFNIPRIDYSNGSCPSILVETATTNQIRNNSMVGAVVGTPGTLPTNWTESLAGLTRQVVDLGTEKGIQYVDIRFSGTASNINQRILFEPTTQIVAANGQTWTLSTYLKIISQPQPPTGVQLLMLELTSAGGLVTFGNQTITPTTSFARYSFTRTLNGGATVARVQPIVNFSTTNGHTYDFTIRIYGPQMQQQPNATSLIQTLTGAVTKNTDVISNTNVATLVGQTEGTVFLDFFYPSGITSGIEIFSIYNSSTAYLFRCRVNSGTGNICAIPYNNGGSAENLTPSFTLTPNTRVKIAVVYDYSTNTSKVFRNGSLIGSTTGVQAYPTTQDKMTVGGFFGSTGPTYTNQITLWKTKLTDAQAIQLTTL